jgi:2-polyprenyl-3-methyl-5-hydroxy-6-metoxy-1,4-benzoquinol methylase
MTDQAPHRLHDAYATKSDEYYAGARADFVALLPNNPTATILEVGCGNGATGALALAQGKCRHYVGIELMPDAASLASTVLTRVIKGDIENLELDVAASSFDALILSEVLEHLVDPWRVLAKLAPLVKAGGLAFASSPNVASLSMIKHLLKGRFDLADHGVRDRTHLRWFTPATYAELFEQAGFTVDRVEPLTPLKPRQKILARLTGRPFLFHSQMNLMATKR